MSHVDDPLVQALGGDGTAAKLVKATLVLYVNRVGSPGAVDLHPVNGNWTEAGVTATSLPPSGGASLFNLPLPAPRSSNSSSSRSRCSARCCRPSSQRITSVSG